MKKANFIWILFLFCLSSLVFAAKEPQKNLSFSFQVEGGLTEKEVKLFGNLIRFWIEEESFYRIAVKSEIHLEMSLSQKADQYLLQAVLSEVSTGKVLAQGVQFFSQLSQFPQALNQIFYQRIFLDQTRSRSESAAKIPSYDIVLALDSSGSMKEEAEAVKEGIRDIFSSLCWNLKHAALRFAFMDYKNPASAYRVQLVNFASGNEKILSRLKEVSAFGKGSPDLEYALYHLMRYGNFRSENRLVFIITDSAPKNSQGVLNQVEKLVGMGLRLFILAADGMSEVDQVFYQELAKKTGGEVVFIRYSLTYLLRDHSLRNFVFQNFFLSEIREQGAVDLTLGRKVRNLDGIESFLTKEGTALMNRKKLSLNLAFLLEELTRPLLVKNPVAVFQWNRQEILVGVSNPQTAKLLEKYYGKRLIIGGHFFPYGQEISIFGPTLRIMNRPVAEPLLQNPEQIKDHPFLYFNIGVFDPPIWYVPVVFKGFRP